MPILLEMKQKNQRQIGTIAKNDGTITKLLFVKQEGEFIEYTINRKLTMDEVINDSEWGKKKKIIKLISSLIF